MSISYIIHSHILSNHITINLYSTNNSNFVDENNNMNMDMDMDMNESELFEKDFISFYNLQLQRKLWPSNAEFIFTFDCYLNDEVIHFLYNHGYTKVIYIFVYIYKLYVYILFILLYDILIYYPYDIIYIYIYILYIYYILFILYKYIYIHIVIPITKI